MVRIADILKNVKVERKGPSEPPKGGEEPSSRGEKEPQSETPQAGAPPARGFRFGSARERGEAKEPAARPSVVPLREAPPSGWEDPRRYVAQAFQTSEANQTANAQETYRKGIVLAQTILDKAKTSEPIAGKEIHGVIEDVIRGLVFGNKELVNLACCEPAAEGTDFLAAKMVNKSILAVEIGIGKKMNKSQLFQLGIAAFLSDLGVTQVLDVVTKKDALSQEDWAKIQSIPAKTVEILKSIPDIHQVVLTVAEEFREKPEGAGDQVKEMLKLDPFSRIVALIDVFEALTHDRPYRSRLMPHEAMRLILREGGKKFEQEALRILIDRIGLFPIGSWVKLSSREFAKVVETNPGQPMRPAVKVLFDERGRQLEEPTRIDLSKNLSVQILQPVAEEELHKLIKKNA